MHSIRRHRGVIVLLLVLVIGTGLGLQLARGSSIVDHAGNVLYAAAVYLGICLVAPAVRPMVVFVAALGICVAVELFQLTPVPAYLGEQFRWSRLVFGSWFAWPDLVGYGIGVLLCGASELVNPRAFGRGRCGSGEG